ncbi:MAG: lipid-binding SYLF domain-containing protein, partial [Candidatus Omnitrophica bacterium]|nr:lipid-binding SYLF domain-containing protein [Candidatus Omnitrophota bacterium]
LLDQRVREAHLAVDKMMSAPDQSIPEELLAKCKAVAIYPSVLKGGFVFGARFGQGVVLKRDEQTGAWGPAAFSTIGGGSWGVQIGVQASDLVLVIMNDRGLEGFLSSRFVLGTDASVAAGPVGRDTQVATDLFLQSGILSYSRSRGLFAGVVLDGSWVTQDNDSNSKYYGKKVTSRDILNGHAVDFHPAAKALAGALDEYSSRWDKRIVKK